VSARSPPDPARAPAPVDELPVDVRELVAPRAPLGVPVPAYDGRSLPNVATSVVRALGSEPSDAALPPLEPSRDPFGGRRAEGPVLLFVVDGLGYERLRTRARRPGGALARTWIARAAPITTVFPSSTTVALASLSTASSPSRHGLVGYRQFLPRFGSVVDMLRMSPVGVTAMDTLLGPAWTPADVLGSPTIFRQAVPGTVAVSRDQFEGRGFTRMIYEGAGYEGYSAWADLAGALVHVLDRGPPPPLVVAYWDELDTVQHLRGPGAGSVDLELDRLGALLDFVARTVPPRVARATRVLVTADHGLVPAAPAQQVALDAEPSIVGLLGRPPTGDRRAGLLKARSGAVDRLEEALVRRLPAGSAVFRSEEAVRHGLFGPPPYHPELFERIADLVVLVPSPAGLTYMIPGRAAARRALLGAHGGLEPEELVVPLVSAPLEQFSLGAPAP
jgi:hypothetical protein